jgi:biopolymer transport protein ExbB/TolQ
MKRIKVHKAYFITWLFILYVVYVNAELLGSFFMATVIFSSAIVGFLAVGTLYQFVSGLDIMMLGGTFGALAYKRTGYEFYIRSIDSILPANIAHMLQSRKNQQQMLFTEDESRDIIDWLEHKFAKQKTYINFFINTSMLIGLLGTFVGLVESIDKMGQIILSLNGDVEISEIMQQFSGPLSGMAIGFGASLFGVVTAVILGLNGYILFRYQDTLISGVEDWLKDRIIDMAPANIEASMTSGTDLGGQRKSFMDVYLDQLSLLTTEITKHSSSNENTVLMANSLASIELILDEQKTYMKSMLELQQNNQIQYETLSSAVTNLYGLTNNRMEEHKVSLDNISQGHNKLLEQNERNFQHAEIAHKELVDGLSDISNSVDQETKEIVNISNKIDQGNGLLYEMSSFQKMQFDKNVAVYADILKNLVTIDKSIKNEITVFEDFSANQIRETNRLSEYQLKSSETLRAAIDSFEKGQAALIELQKHGVEKNTQESSALLAEMKEVARFLEGNKQSIEALLKLQENFKFQDLEFQKEIQALNTDRSNSIEKGFKSINTLIDQLSRMEHAFIAYSKERQEQNEKFLQNEADQNTQIFNIQDRLNNSSELLNKNTATLKKIEKLVIDIDKHEMGKKSKPGKKPGAFTNFLNKIYSK